MISTNYRRAPFKPKPSKANANVGKPKTIWRKKLSENIVHVDSGCKDLVVMEITIPERLISPHVEFLRKIALRVQIQTHNLSKKDIQAWIFSNWLGTKEVLFHDQVLSYFSVLFISAETQDWVHKFKGWFCNGFGISTCPFSPNFSPESSDVIFFPHWIELP